MEAIGRYRAHRQERIAQVVRALRQGPAEPGDLIDRVYGPELHPALRGAAEGSLRAPSETFSVSRRSAPWWSRSITCAMLGRSPGLT